MQNHIVGGVEITITVLDTQYDPDQNFLQLALLENTVTGVVLSDGSVVIASKHEEIVVQTGVTKVAEFDMDGYYALQKKLEKNAKNPKPAGTINDSGEIIRE